MQVGRWRHLQGSVLASYAGWVWRTARFQVEGRERWDEALASGRPVIFCAWHGMTMMITGYLAAHDDTSLYRIIVPDDHRGETLTVWVRRAGGDTIPISMEDGSMAAARRLLNVIREARRGKRLYINPDGPKGPSHVPKRGIAFIAQRAEALVVPLGAHAATAYRLRRWDRYTIPLPYSRISLAVGEPLDVRRDADLDATLATLTDALNAAESTAEALYYRR